MRPIDKIKFRNKNLLTLVHSKGISFATFGARLGCNESSTWLILSSGLIYYRKGINNGFYVIEASTDGGIHWEELLALDPNADTIEKNIDNGEVGYRHLIRNEAYVIDHVLTPLGFGGIQGTDWQEVVNIIHS